MTIVRGLARRRLLWCGLGILLAGNGAADAQECHSPGGRWRLDMAHSDLAAGLSFNPYDAVDSATLGVTTMPDGTMRQEWSFGGPHLHERDAYAFRVDGTQQATGTVSALDSVPTAVIASWQNCTLLITGISHLFGIEVRTDNTYVLSEHGRVLTVLQHGQSMIGRTTRRLVFQPDIQGGTP